MLAPKAQEHKCWPEKVFSTNNSPPPPPPHLSSQNDQRDVGIILSHRCWVDPRPPRHGRSGTRALNPPSRHGGQGRGGALGKWASVSPPPPPQSNFLPALCHSLGILCQIVQWYLRSGPNFSPLQVSPFQLSHVPNPPGCGLCTPLGCPRPPAVPDPPCVDSRPGHTRQRWPRVLRSSRQFLPQL